MVPSLSSLTPMDRALLSLASSHPPTGHDPAMDTPSHPWHHYSRPTVGQLLRSTLKHLHLSQRDLAIRLGIHYVTLNRLVQGLYTTLQPESRWKLESLCQPHPQLRTMYRLVDWPYATSARRKD